ncbi:MAG: hypothetical protein Kow0058_17420 [Roseovarius sp.]
MGQVTRLKQSEQVRLDPDPLDQLVLRMGHAAAEDLVRRALHELSDRLIEVEELLRRDQLARMGKCARSLGAIAEQLGMRALARVARDVAACAAAGDRVAIAATVARLMRLGEGSLAQIWAQPAI